jgi:hypothetical protein
MRTLCPALGRILPIALASLPGALVLHLDSVAHILQVTAFQDGHYLCHAVQGPYVCFKS